MASPEPPFPPSFPVTFPPTNYIWHSPRLSTSLFSSPTPTSTDFQVEHLLLFIPGNPGLIGYYSTFISRLSAGLPSPWGVLGLSHAGFYVVSEAGWDAGGEENRMGKGTGVGGTWSLNEQVEMKVELLKWVARWCGERCGGKRGNLKVVLVGHSMGAWVAMEMARCLFEESRRSERSSAQDDGGKHPAVEWNIEVLGGSLLFPTITHIAKSKSGRVFTPLLNIHPSLIHLNQILTNGLTTLIPTFLLRKVVGFITGFSSVPLPSPPTVTSPTSSSSLEPPHNPLDTTLAFLNTPKAILQSLGMARDEMNQIKSDNFPPKVWDLKWVMYFADDDHWVDDSEREELIKKRGMTKVVDATSSASDGDAGHSTGVRDGAGGVVQRGIGDIDTSGVGEQCKSGRAKMVICTEGISHGFCIRHGEIMGEKVAGWVSGEIAQIQGY